jgi:hypothetical protein
MSRDSSSGQKHAGSSNVAAPNSSIDFGFDAEVAAGEAAESNGSSPPIAVPTNKANHARPNLSVQVAYEPPEFRTVSPGIDFSNMEAAMDSPIGGGLMYE